MEESKAHRGCRSEIAAAAGLYLVHSSLRNNACRRFCSPRPPAVPHSPGQAELQPFPSLSLFHELIPVSLLAFHPPGQSFELEDWEIILCSFVAKVHKHGVGCWRTRTERKEKLCLPKKELGEGGTGDQGGNKKPSSINQSLDDLTE